MRVVETDDDFELVHVAEPNDELKEKGVFKAC